MKLITRDLAGLLVGWVVCSVLYWLAIYIESGTFPLLVMALVSLVIFIYTLLIGIPVGLLARRLRQTDKLAGIVTGSLAAVPLLFFYLYQQDYFFALLTFFAGPLYGFIFATIKN